MALGNVAMNLAQFHRGLFFHLMIGRIFDKEGCGFSRELMMFQCLLYIVFTYLRVSVTKSCKTGMPGSYAGMV